MMRLPLSLWLKVISPCAPPSFFGSSRFIRTGVARTHLPTAWVLWCPELFPVHSANAGGALWCLASWTAPQWLWAFTSEPGAVYHHAIPKAPSVVRVLGPSLVTWGVHSTDPSPNTFITSGAICCLQLASFSRWLISLLGSISAPWAAGSAVTIQDTAGDRQRQRQWEWVAAAHSSGSFPTTHQHLHAHSGV